MRTWLWLALLAGALGAGAYLLWLDEPAVRDADHAIETKLVLDEGLARLRALEIISANARVRVERHDGGWRYAHRAAHDPTAASTFISERLAMFAVARTERSFSADPGVDARYGFDVATLHIDLFVDGGVAPRRLTVGARTPGGLARYLRVTPGRRVLTLPAYHIDNLARMLPPTAAWENSQQVMTRSKVP